MQYNNPASETLYVQIVEENVDSRTVSSTPKYYEGEYTLELYDKNTTLVRRMVCNTPQVQMPVSDLAPGNYYLRLVVEEQVIEIEQIIIN